MEVRRVLFRSGYESADPERLLRVQAWATLPTDDEHERPRDAGSTERVRDEDVAVEEQGAGQAGQPQRADGDTSRGERPRQSAGTPSGEHQTGHRHKHHPDVPEQPQRPSEQRGVERMTGKGRPAVVGRLRLRYGEDQVFRIRSEEHTSELQSLMRISYAV